MIVYSGLNLIDREHRTHDPLEWNRSGVLRRRSVGQRHYITGGVFFQIREDIALLDDCHIIIHPVHAGAFKLNRMRIGLAVISDNDIDRRAFHVNGDTLAERLGDAFGSDADRPDVLMYCVSWLRLLWITEKKKNCRNMR